MYKIRNNGQYRYLYGLSVLDAFNLVKQKIKRTDRGGFCLNWHDNPTGCIESIIGEVSQIGCDRSIPKPDAA